MFLNFRKRLDLYNKHAEKKDHSIRSDFVEVCSVWSPLEARSEPFSSAIMHRGADKKGCVGQHCIAFLFCRLRRFVPCKTKR